MCHKVKRVFFRLSGQSDDYDTLEQFCTYATTFPPLHVPAYDCRNSTVRTFGVLEAHILNGASTGAFQPTPEHYHVEGNPPDM